ncbi:hypothetical protein MBLNU230_g6750t1 [Neophaeotheca triangularis]
MRAPMMHSPCASCRLRSTLTTLRLARSKNPFHHATPRALFATTPGRQQTLPPNELQTLIYDLDSASETFGLDSRTYAARSRTKAFASPSSSGLSAKERVELVRRRLGDVLPEGVLTDEELRIYERLYGRPLSGEEVGEEGLEDGVEGGDVAEEEMETRGTGLLREGRDGRLEEVEFEVEDEGLAEEGDEEVGVEFGEADEKLARDMERAMDGGGVVEAVEDLEDRNGRIHPLTIENRFATNPTTLQLPKHSLVDPITLLLSGMPHTHLSETAHRVFGGLGLPWSTSTPATGKLKQQKAIPLDAYQGRMSQIEGDAYLATMMPGVFASVMSVLVETRKRLGTAWAEDLVRKASAGELKILDAGGAGAGVLAVREMLRAEWQRMHDEAGTSDTGAALAEADGRIGGAGSSPPLGAATVLTGSDTLRQRASQLLEDTTFIPRLPDYVHTQSAKDRGKFDIVIAPHTLWPLQENYQRKTHTQNLWSLAKHDGGVLLLLEKGVPRGFERVAAARQLLLDTRIASPGSEHRSTDVDEPSAIEWEDAPEPLTKQKDIGMIIAPCTNHSGCPMYTRQGIVRGRKDFCHFEQRYIRPGFLQKILGAKGKNFEDVKFSYLSVMRGRDLRQADEQDTDAEPVVQGKLATDRAFEGYEDLSENNATLLAREAHGADPNAMPSADDFFENPDPLAAEDPATTDAAGPPPHPLSLPRAILPPIKRRGHVILDLCTPSGSLERWTVPRSLSRQAFRDARKSSWGDLWALGAKTRVPRSARAGQKDGLGVEDEEGKVQKARRRTVSEDVGEGGKMRNGKKIGGVRDKREKKPKKGGKGKGAVGG